MLTLDDQYASAVRDLRGKLETFPKSSVTVDDAAQRCVTAVFERLRSSAVLVRLFATIPSGELPPELQRSAREYAASRGVLPLLSPRTPVLTLLGTRGVDPAWNDRRRSKSYATIPLASPRSIGAAPMMSRLFHDLGLGLEWMESSDPLAVEEVLKGGLSGLFYVEDAATATDSKGRKIIPMQDFVASHRVRSVFGACGAYLDGTFLALIVFSSESVPRAAAERFVPLLHVFKGATAPLVSRRAFF